MENDTYVVVKVGVVADVTVDIFSFTRQDVIVKLMEFAANAAAVFGPYSEEVSALESDIDAVKYDDAPLADFIWCFPQFDDFEKVED